MKLELVWRNPEPLPKHEQKIEAAEYDKEGAVYQVRSEEGVRAFEVTFKPAA